MGTTLFMIGDVYGVPLRQSRDLQIQSLEYVYRGRFVYVFVGMSARVHI